MNVRWLDFSNSKLSLERSIWTYAKGQKLVGSLIRGRNRQLQHFDNIDYINVGCGDKIASGFCNLDYQWRPGVLCWDVTKGIPFGNGSLSGVFSEHCLEHLRYDQALFVLGEFRRILRPGCVARVIVPDGELYCRVYVKAMDGTTVGWPYPTASDTAMGQLNWVMRDHGHLYIYDYETLRNAMRESGFREVSKAAYRNGGDPNLLIDQQHRAAESLYVEGIA